MQHDVTLFQIMKFQFLIIISYTKSGPKTENINILIYNFKNNSFNKIFDESINEIEIKTGAGGLSDFLNDGSILIEEQAKEDY